MNFAAIFEELKLLSDKDIYKSDKIEWWLLKYKEDYQYQYINKESRSNTKITYRVNAKPHIKKSIDLENDINVFLDTYEVLNKITDFYRLEVYFKQQIQHYNTIKNDVKCLSNWLEFHKLDESKKYKEFVSLFQDKRTLSGYSFEITYPFSLPFEIWLDESEFLYILEFLAILERSNKVLITGSLSIINDMEVIKINNSQTYKRQYIILSIEDEHESELLIVFLHSKTELLENFKIGQKVRIYAQLLGRKEKSNKLDYAVSLLGWDIKTLTN